MPQLLVLSLITTTLLYLAQVTHCDEASLYNNLTEHYVRYVRPIANHSETIDVHLAFELLKVIHVDEKTQVITIVGFVVAAWKDTFLKWRPSDWGGIDQIVVPPNKIWIPDIGFENSAGSFYDTSFLTDFRCRVRHDGHVLWSFGGQIDTICPLDMTFYPFDIQHCKVQLENWAYAGHEVDLHMEHDFVDIDGYEQNGVWALDHTNVSRVIHTYHATGDIPFPEVTFHLYLRRKSLFYLLNLIIPCIFIIAVALGVYWVPPESGEKVSLGITVLLAFSVFLLVIAESTPETSDYAPILGKLVATIMGLSTLSVMTSIVVLYVHHKHARRRVPAWLRTFAFKGLARLLCMCMVQPEADQKPTGKTMAYDANTMSRAYVLMEAMGDDQYPEKMNFTSGSELDIRRILHRLTYLVNRYKRHEVEKEIKGEWKLLGKVIDRLMFFLSVLVIVIVLCVFTTNIDQTH